MSSDRVRAGWAAYAVLVLIHLGLQILAPSSPATRATQVLLAPLLMTILLAAVASPRPHTTTWTLIALVFCLGGDLLPALVPESMSFLALVGSFLIAQACFIVAFAPWRDRSVLRHRRVVVVLYLAAYLTLIILVGPDTGWLFVPVVIYGATLTTMAVLSTGLGRVGGIGGALFFVSDALIAITTFAGAVPASGALIMATYAVALAALVAAVISRAVSR